MCVCVTVRTRICICVKLSENEVRDEERKAQKERTTGWFLLCWAKGIRCCYIMTRKNHSTLKGSELVANSNVHGELPALLEGIIKAATLAALNYNIAVIASLCIFGWCPM